MLIQEEVFKFYLDSVDQENVSKSVPILKEDPALRFPISGW